MVLVAPVSSQTSSIHSGAHHADTNAGKDRATKILQDAFSLHANSENPLSLSSCFLARKAFLSFKLVTIRFKVHQ